MWIYRPLLTQPPRIDLIHGIARAVDLAAAGDEHRPERIDAQELGRGSVVLAMIYRRSNHHAELLDVVSSYLERPVVCDVAQTHPFDMVHTHWRVVISRCRCNR